MARDVERCRKTLESTFAQDQTASECRPNLWSKTRGKILQILPPPKAPIKGPHRSLNKKLGIQKIAPWRTKNQGKKTSSWLHVSRKLKPSQFIGVILCLHGDLGEWGRTGDIQIVFSAQFTDWGSKVPRFRIQPWIFLPFFSLNSLVKGKNAENSGTNLFEYS